jgi:hypothetical protein
VALGYENCHCKYIFTGCFLKAIASRSYAFLLAVNLRKQSVKMNLHWRFMVWSHSFISSGAYRLSTANETMATTKRNRRYTSVSISRWAGSKPNRREGLQHGILPWIWHGSVGTVRFRTCPPYRSRPWPWPPRRRILQTSKLSTARPT